MARASLLGEYDIRDRIKDGSRVVASYPTYPEAQRAVDHLSDRGFPVENMSIVAQGLRLVEDVTGRLGYVGAAGQGLAQGALVGAVLGFVLGVFDWVDPVVSALAMGVYGLVLGALVGALAGIAAHWAQGGRRNFSSIGRLEATRYDLSVDGDEADRAQELIEQVA